MTTQTATLQTLTRRLKTRAVRRLRQFHYSLIVTLAAMALSACGGGGGAGADAPGSTATPAGTPGVDLIAAMASEFHPEPADPAEAGGPGMQQLASVGLTMTKVSFTNSAGQTLTGFVFHDGSAAQRNAAVVMMHGCSGVWSNGVISTDAQPAMNKLSHIHRRWGSALAQAGYTALLVDSFTSRDLNNECGNGTAGLNEATERPKDALAGRAWLLANTAIAADRIGVLGWSNGASAVLATMDRSNEGSPGARPFALGVAFYPGCGLINEFGGDASTPAKTSWLPYAPVTIHHAALDPLYTDNRCENRRTTAVTLGASTDSGNPVTLTVHAAARHSFDLIDISKTISAPYTAADKTAQIAADAQVMNLLDTRFGGM